VDWTQHKREMSARPNTSPVDDLKRSLSPRDSDTTASNKHKKSKSETSQEVSYKKMMTWLEQFRREAMIDGTDGSTDEEVGTIMWSEDGKDVGCSFAGMLYLLDNLEVENKLDDDSLAKEQIETYFAPVAKFPEMLEKLAVKLMEGAQLAREAGLDKVVAFDAEGGDSTDEDYAEAEGGTEDE
jgi:hypothetical protein